MKKLLSILISSAIMMSCGSIKYLNGRTFSFSSQKRKLEFFFENDSICIMRNIFFCSEIDEKYKKITISCKYKKEGNLIILKNIDCKSDNCKFDLAYFIPPQQSSNCLFLNRKFKKGNKNMFGPKYLSNDEVYGIVPNIDIDTIQITKNKLVFYKADGVRSIGFVLK